MPERIRSLNHEGTQRFRQFVESVRAGAIHETPIDLLTDSATSDELEPEMTCLPVTVNSRLELGRRLAGWLQPAEQRVISRNAGLWNWLSLRLFDQLCPPDSSGRRYVRDTPHYVLDPVFSYQKYYRHLVRFAWLAFVTHEDWAKVILSSSERAGSAVGQWGEMSEQLGAYQDILGSKTVIEAASLLYLDESGNLIRGFGSRNQRGNVRRIPRFLDQLGLTYDLRTCPVQDFLNLLPSEFERWVREYRKRGSREVRPQRRDTGDSPNAKP